jgi:hypothetical protein
MSSKLQVRAHTAWREGRPLEAGRLLFEPMAAPQRVSWALQILELCASTQDPVAEVERILRLANDPKAWNEAHDAFAEVRRLGLALDPASEQVEMREALLRVAEKVAKVIYNASGCPAPFDQNSGWRLAQDFHSFLALQADPSLTAQGTTLLFGSAAQSAA